MGLDRYKRKRDFSRTPEPSGDGAPDAAAVGEVASSGVAGGRFVVQRHRARALHYDFRLEIDGVLVSWAVPKGPTLDPAVRRGAFHVEDHPLDYFDFEGTIPRGQYGAGDVIVWDWGRFRAEATDDPGRAVRDGELKFELFGEKLRGRFTIVRTRGGAGRPGARGTQTADPAEREQWLLIKKRDNAAVSGWDPESLPRSVKTDRTNDEVAAGVATTDIVAGPPPSAAPLPSPANVPGARSAPMPDFVEPMKATLTDRPFSHPSWLFELKWDGYRVQAHVRDGHVALFTRRAQNAASYFPELAGPATWLAAREAILDGEVVALNAAGEPDFGLLQAWQSGRRGRRGGPQGNSTGDDPGPATLVYEVFDLLYVDGLSLLDVALEDRKRLLRSVVRDSPSVRYAGHVDGDGEAFYSVVAERGLEGMVAKLRRSRYEPGRRSGSWLKIKRRRDQELVIGGWTPRAGSDVDLGALLVGVHDGGVLRAAGKVGTGFDASERARLLSLMEPLARATSPFRPAPREKLVRWVEPRLVARVEFAEWSADGALRAPSYKGLELDSDPSTIVREIVGGSAPAEPVGPGGAASESLAERSSREAAIRGATTSGAGDAFDPATLAALDALPGSGGKWSVGGRELKLSNLDKLIWPADGITKRDLIRYYVSSAPYALPYLRDRALTVMRHPNGINRPGFWQKQLPSHTPAWVARWSWESVSAGEIRDYAVADGAATLAWLANEAAIDLHPSTFRIDAPDRPTWALIDIDPGPQTSWEDLLVLARLYRAALDHLGVIGFPKVTGQRGIQVWIPIRPIYTFEQTRDWVGGVSRAVGATVPELVSWEWEKTRRGGLARLDYTQNAANKTLVAPYAVRPAAGAPVSAPISWAELDDPALRPNAWTIRSMPARLAERGDLFAPSLGLEQELPAL
ncbi:MAG: DNA ligase D [Candidatus Limnocylindrales bacterium]|jgi:bifunctional non-homologous end joining protein LigD